MKEPSYDILRIACTLTMAADPFPGNEDDHHKWKEWLNSYARELGFADWIDAYHQWPSKERKEKNMSSLYRKKPVVVEAIRWTGDNLHKVIEMTGLHPSAKQWTWEEYEQVVKEKGLKIFTPRGPVMAGIGDWIIKGVKGEVYPCKPDIFEKTYEPVEE